MAEQFKPGDRVILRTNGELGKIIDVESYDSKIEAPSYKVRLESGREVSADQFMLDDYYEGKKGARLSLITSSRLNKIVEAASPVSVEMYHGTAFSNLPSIAKEGLKALSGQYWSAVNLPIEHKGAVYLTPDLEKAIRYAVGAAKDQLPVVLEVVLTSPRRFNIMREDPMDQSEMAWGDDFSYSDAADAVYDVELILERGLKKIIGRYTGKEPLSVWFGRNGLDFDNVADFDGLNLYKFVLKYLSEFEGLPPRSDLMKVIPRVFPSGELTENLDIRPDGTLKLSEDYWNTREQAYYMKPIPPSAIKGVWVRADDFDLSKVPVIDRQQFSVKALPGEASQRLEDVRDILDRISDLDHGEVEDTDYYERAEWLDDYGMSDYADKIREFGDLGKEGREEIEDEINDEIFEMESWLDEDWREDYKYGEADWVLVNPNDALKLRPGA